MFGNAELRAARAVGLKLMHLWSCLEWLAQRALILTRSWNVYWPVGFNRLWEVIPINPLPKGRVCFTIVHPASCTTCSQSIQVMESLHLWATLPVFHWHHPACQCIVLYSQKMEDRLFPPSLLKPLYWFCNRLPFSFPKTCMKRSPQCSSVLHGKWLLCICINHVTRCDLLSEKEDAVYHIEVSIVLFMRMLKAIDSLQTWNTWSSKNFHQ